MPSNQLKKQPNIVLLITDEQSWIQNWDPEWAKENLPALYKLMDKGLTFERAHCNTCTCSPSRATLFSSTYPAYHKVTEVLGNDKPQDPEQTMQNIFSANYQNMFKMMEQAGYHVEYKGKWHLTKPAVFLNNENNKIQSTEPLDELYWTAADTDQLSKLWRANGWNYPDAGGDMALYNLGGGDVNNDGRFIDGHGQSGIFGNRLPGKTEKQTQKEKEEASVLHFLNTYKENHGEKPFFLVVSLVNPHDVLAFPGTAASTERSEKEGGRPGMFIPKFPIDGTPLYIAGGYKDKDFENIEVKLPGSINEDLKTKPYVQTAFKKLCQANGPIHSEDEARRYIQFYAYLTSLADKELDKVLLSMDDNDFTKDTLIVRVSDHGDMAMAHGMQRQKMYNVYRETLNVPMIFSNPKLFPKGKTTNSLSGLVDIMPTLATFAGVDKKRWNFQGKDLTPIMSDPEWEVQKYVHFTYDDTYLTLRNPADMGPAHIRCIVSKEWKYAVYFDPHYGMKAQYEMYNLKDDPEEMINLAWKKKDGGKQRQILHKQLTKMMMKLGTMPDTIVWPEISGVDVYATQPVPKAKD